MLSFEETPCSWNRLAVYSGGCLAAQPFQSVPFAIAETLDFGPFGVVVLDLPTRRLPSERAPRDDATSREQIAAVNQLNCSFFFRAVIGRPLAAFLSCRTIDTSSPADKRFISRACLSVWAQNRNSAL